MVLRLTIIVLVSICGSYAVDKVVQLTDLEVANLPRFRRQAPEHEAPPVDLGQPIASVKASYSQKSQDLNQDAQSQPVGFDEYDAYDNETVGTHGLEGNVEERYNVTYDSIDHRYYVESVLAQMNETEFYKHWVDIEKVLESSQASVFGSTNHSRLSNSYRRAASYHLRSFEFPFYGQKTRDLTIATGGFAYMGTTMHSWLAATQYIAPLMANFDTSQSNRSNILYVETDDYIAIEWREVVLRAQKTNGNFTFMVKLSRNGDIHFMYKHIPIDISLVSDQYHPLKVGISDAYLMQTPVFAFHKKVIYEYHRIEIEFKKIKSFTVIQIKAQPVCVQLASCSECVTAVIPHFNCSWCTQKALNESFCSDEFGMHRRRQEWIQQHCDKQRSQMYCSEIEGGGVGGGSEAGGGQPDRPTPQASGPPVVPATTPQSGGPVNPKLPPQPSDTKFGMSTTTSGPNAQMVIAGTGNLVSKEAVHAGHMTTGSVIGIIFLISLILAAGGWTVYAYNNPHTPSGQFLIRHRPSRWRLPGNHGDVRYTASVHM